MAILPQPNVSFTFLGLGKVTHTVAKAGLYCLKINSTVPSEAADSPASVASPIQYAAFDIACVADVKASLNGAYFTFNIPGDFIKYYVWFSVFAPPQDPNPKAPRVDVIPEAKDPSLKGYVGLKVSILEDSSAEDVALAISKMVNGKYFNALATNDHVVITSALAGDLITVENAEKELSPGFSYQVTPGSYGTASALQVVVTLNDQKVLKYGFPEPGESAFGAVAYITCALNDVINIDFSSTAPIDQTPQAISTVIELNNVKRPINFA